jgi:2,4-dienoyl-CoA reductase-like NADH-dependent reductase (Old Yellow Enzyme family)
VDVDPSTPDSVADTMAQIELLVAAGIDFIEISGGTYENPRMMAEPSEPASTIVVPAESPKVVNNTTATRESFFLEFAAQVRIRFPSVVLLVTGGFRTRLGMSAALNSGACDLIGIARPAAVMPRLPKEVILNQEITDEKASVVLERLRMPWLMSWVPIRQIGAGWQSTYYAGQIQRMGRGESPVNTIVRSVV